MKMVAILIFVLCILILRGEPMQQQPSPLSDIFIGMSKEAALSELRKNYQIRPVPAVRRTLISMIFRAGTGKVTSFLSKTRLPRSHNMSDQPIQIGAP